LSAEATELKDRCNSLEGDKDSLSKLNAKLEEEKQQLNHAMGTRSILDNSMEDKLVVQRRGEEQKEVGNRVDGIQDCQVGGGEE